MRFDADPKELFRELRSDLEFSLRRFKRHPAVEAAMAKLGIALADRLAQLREIVKPYTNTHALASNFVQERRDTLSEQSAFARGPPATRPTVSAIETVGEDDVGIDRAQRDVIEAGGRGSARIVVAFLRDEGHFD